MSVLIRTAQIIGIGGTPLARQFSDTFNRATGTLGGNWCTGLYNCQNATVANTMYSAGFSISALFDATQGMKMNQSPNGGGIQNAGQCGFMIPNVLMYLAAGNAAGSSPRQFSRITFYHGALSGGAGFGGGPACMMNFGIGTSPASCYFADINTSAKTLGSIAAFSNTGLTGATYYVPLALGGALNDGDIIELQVTPGIASNFVEVFKNGTSQGSATDNNAGRPTFGTVGVFSQPFSANLGVGTGEWKNFVGGLF